MTGAAAYFAAEAGGAAAFMALIFSITPDSSSRAHRASPRTGCHISLQLR